MKDVVIGAITNYSFDKIKYWVNSLDRSGFDGVKAMICYNIDYDVAEELSRRNYTVFALGNNEYTRRLEYNKPNFNICLERFIHLWYFLKEMQKTDVYRYVVSTDVRDVIFQTNPSEWLEKNIGNKKINVACESIKYEDEGWGKNNLNLSFGPLIYDQMKSNPIYNAGTISGEINALSDLFLNIFLSCGAAPVNVPGGGGPDQAALNVLLNLESYKSITNFAMSDDGYAAQLGTTKDPRKIETFRPYLLEPEPIMVDDMVCTSTGKPFSIVHQYDRVPEWKTILEKKYG